MDCSKSIKTSSVAQTVNAGKEFGQSLSETAVVLLKGEMGAGKTHFVKGMAQGLNIGGNVTSPTFALVNTYDGLYHFDLFRLGDIDDLYAIGFYDYIGLGVMAIEWAENIPGLEAEFDEYYTVKLDKTSENERVITIDYSRT